MHPCWRDIDLSHNKDTLPGEDEKGVLSCLCAYVHMYACENQHFYFPLFLFIASHSNAFSAPRLPPLSVDLF